VFAVNEVITLSWIWPWSLLLI